jgi:acetoin utilization protein AcuB
MLVGDRMSRPVITVHPELSIQEALFRMRRENVRRFPVVDKRGQLVGIISEMDLLEASPSDVSSLSVHELNYLLHKITVDEIMTKNVITVDEDTTVEEAARIMVDKKIGGLPVLSKGEVVGIITETDLFKIFFELLGSHERGVRISVLVPNQPGELAKLTKAVFEAGGNILSLGTFLGESTENREILMTVESDDIADIKQAVEPFVEEILDIRETRLV